MNIEKNKFSWWRDRVESTSLELKSGNADPDDIGKAVCGFANAGGGSILVGINEKGEAVGVPQQDPIVALLRKQLADHLSPRLAVSISPIQIKDKDLLIIDVPQGMDRPYTWDRMIYVRKQDRTIDADAKTIGELLKAPKRYHWERQPALGIEFSDLDEEEIRKSFDEARRHHLLKEGIGFNLMEALQLFHLAEEGQILNGALVLFGRQPENRLPQTRVRAVCYSDTEGDNLIDSRVFQGNAFRLIEQILEFLKRHISISSQIPTGHLQRQEKFDYPFSALREAILNAVQHRDYEAYDGGISVIIKPHSLEIWNSGALPAGMTPDDLKREHHSRPHNPDIAHIFFLRGYVERIGSGAGRMVKWCRSAGLPDPEWRQDSGGVAVVFRKTGETAALNERQKQFLMETRFEAVFSTVEYKQQFSISDRQARNDLTDLIKMGYLRRTGSGPATRYVRTEKEVE
jgi:ATP-dependent DNA helicase RecG